MDINTTLSLFIAKYVGRAADYDGFYGAQCYDLVQFWSKELGGSPFVGMYAKDIYGQLPHQYISIENTIEAVPEPGDIIVWSGKYNNGPGHTGIAVDSISQDTFNAFVQNDPVGELCTIKKYNYSFVRGWLRFKRQNIPENQANNALQECLRQHGQLVEKLNKQDRFINTIKEGLRILQ